MNLVKCNECFWRGFDEDLLTMEQDMEEEKLCPLCKSSDIEIIGYMAYEKEESYDETDV